MRLFWRVCYCFFRAIQVSALTPAYPHMLLISKTTSHPHSISWVMRPSLIYSISCLPSCPQLNHHQVSQNANCSLINIYCSHIRCFLLTLWYQFLSADEIVDVVVYWPLIFASTEIPAQVDAYCDLVPLEPPTNRIGQFGFPSTMYKAVSQKDGLTYCLCRIHGKLTLTVVCLLVFFIFPSFFLLCN